MSDDIERTLTVLRECHVYTLPPRPHGGFRCQDWPKTSHIFSGRVRVVTRGTVCTVGPPDKCTLAKEAMLSGVPTTLPTPYCVMSASSPSPRCCSSEGCRAPAEGLAMFECQELVKVGIAEMSYPVAAVHTAACAQAMC